MVKILKSIFTKSTISIRGNALFLFIIFMLALIFAAAMYWANFFANRPDFSKVDEVRVEIVKSLLQLSVVIIIGGIVAFLFKLAEQIREQARLRAEIRSDYLKRLGSQYRAVKAVRRKLRVEGLTSKYRSEPIMITHSQFCVYKDQMEFLNKSQLELEALKIESEHLPVFASLGLYAYIEKMEKYLGKLISEFEEKFPELKPDLAVSLREFTRLDEFTGETKAESDSEKKCKPDGEPCFKNNFSCPYEEAVKCISKNLT